MTTYQRFGSVVRLLFASTEPIDRKTYATVGFGLAGLKYLGDQLIVWLTSGTIWTLRQYFSPFMADRDVGISVLTILGVWALPFVWVGVWMTARRAMDANLPSGLAFLFFVPFVNYLLIACLLAVRSARAKSPEQGLRLDPRSGSNPSGRLRLDRDLLVGVGVSAIVGAVIAVLLLTPLGSGGYALSLFLGAPFLIGAAAAIAYNFRGKHSWVASHGVAQLALLATGGFLLLSGLEGLICIGMAYPLAVPLVALGSVLGHRMTRSDGPRAMAAMLILVPALSLGERALSVEPRLREVVSMIEIDAPPEDVWTNVVAFSELPAPNRWVFKAGIAYPQRARYDGVGVGAVRYCEFSTGPFVEPITVWDAPYTLAFEVTEQPPTMDELSPYADLQPAHLTESLRSRRGEFRLQRLPGDRTRLEGSTWYTIDMYPQWYWTIWSDALIQAIHDRVLEHIRDSIELGPTDLESQSPDEVSGA